MSYEKVKNLKLEEFKRLCGVHPKTFSQMSEVVRSRFLNKAVFQEEPAKVNYSSAIESVENETVDTTATAI